MHLNTFEKALVLSVIGRILFKRVKGSEEFHHPSGSLGSDHCILLFFLVHLFNYSVKFTMYSSCFAYQ